MDISKKNCYGHPKRGGDYPRGQSSIRDGYMAIRTRKERNMHVDAWSHARGYMAVCKWEYI
jgi:hypothetical protein